MMTLEKKEHIINNDVNWKQINKANLAIIVTTMITFLTTIQLIVRV